MSNTSKFLLIAGVEDEESNVSFMVDGKVVHIDTLSADQKHIFYALSRLVASSLEKVFFDKKERLTNANLN